MEDLVVEFVGGPYDGHVANTRNSDDMSAKLAGFIYLVSDGGHKIGCVVDGLSPAAIEGITSRDRPYYQYRLVDRWEVNGRVRVRMEHVALPSVD